MEGTIKKIALALKQKSVLVLILCSLVFVASITTLFRQERRKLDADYAGMIMDSLNVHTQIDAAEIDRMIDNAKRALQTAEAMLRFSGTDQSQSIEARLANRNARAPDNPVEYISIEALTAGALSVGEADLQRLIKGEVAVDIRQDGAMAAHALFVMAPLSAQSGMTGVLYTRLPAAALFPDNARNIIYQNVQSVLITGDGDLVFNTYQPDHGGSLFEDFVAYGLTQTEIDRIAAIIDSQEIDATTFLRSGKSYFVSAAPLSNNGWRLVSVVRGADVLLRSSSLFRDVVRTGIIAILITAVAVCVVFLQLLSSKKRLMEEQQRNHVFIQRFQAMFEQHSALKVVVDAATREVVDANPALLSYFGHTKEEMLGRSMREFNLLPPDVVAQRYRAELNADLMFSSAPFRIKNGEIRLLDVYASFILEGERRLLYAILFDVTDRERYWKELLQEKELLRTTLQSIGDGVVTTDSLGRITNLNSVSEHLVGWDKALATGRPFQEVFVLQNEETGQLVENPVEKVLETGRVIGLANHTELVSRTGARIPIADSAAPIKAEGGQTLGVVMVFRDVSDEKAHSREIAFLSYHDALTGLYNRRYMEEMMLRPDLAGRLPISVVMADVNGLKITNDVFGHQTGDALLKSVAGLMRACCKPDDVIARWGGDEFVILMPETTLESAEVVIGKMKNTPVEIESSGLSLSISLGCACKDSAQADIQQVLQQAEENMYQQKLLDGKSYRNAIISTLLATLYEKSNETQAHSKRLETYCHAVGRALGLSSREMDELSLLALLHDIGKVGIHPNILQKPGPLTVTQWDEMRRHPEIGYRIAQATPELAAIANLILSHHERWDGQGYPFKLKGTEIPLACRILSVVDAFDAMTNDRIYRKAVGVARAIREIEENAGTQFDPRIAALFLEILANQKEHLSEWISSPIT